MLLLLLLLLLWRHRNVTSHTLSCSVTDVTELFCNIRFQNFNEFCPKNYLYSRIFMIFVQKLNKITEFYMIFSEKLSIFPNFYDICPKNKKIREYYMIDAGKNITIPELLWYLSQKLTKFQNFTWILTKNCKNIRIFNKIPEFYMIFPKYYQNTRIFMIFVQKVATILSKKLPKFQNFASFCPENYQYSPIFDTCPDN